MLRAAIIAVLLAPGPALALACPATLTTRHPGFERLGPPPDGKAALSSGALIDGPPGEETRPAPATLAPDRSEGRGPAAFRNEWVARPGLLMVCRYVGTSTYLRATLPEGTSRCTMTRGSGRFTFSCA
jgi:hypothetical protein